MGKVWISGAVKHHISSRLQHKREMKVCLSEITIVLRVFCFSQLSQSEPIYTASLVHNENNKSNSWKYKMELSMYVSPSVIRYSPKAEPWRTSLSAAYLCGNHTSLGALSARHPPQCLSVKSKGGSVSPETAADGMENESDAAVWVCAHLLSLVPSQRIWERTWCRFLCG